MKCAKCRRKLSKKQKKIAKALGALRWRIAGNAPGSANFYGLSVKSETGSRKLSEN